ncbi:MAG: leucyl aminopeptidase [Verrucomicrobiales bacterium]|jgi:leucyl aminopeptidase|nr:leucyl aminopeptidase [Verrucomicrobiales bacterium]MBT6451110.1 leucyl aminopeptidase [Verrucomicrobiales bacterium]
MNITIHSGNWEELDVDALAVPMAKGSTVDAALDVRLGSLPSELIDSGEFTGKAGACTLIHRVPESAVKRVFLIGLGEAPMARHWFAAAGQAVRAAAKAKCRSVALLLPHDACARLAAEGAGFGQHRPSGYTEQKPWPVEEVVLLTTGDQAIADAGRITAECVNLARELVEIPANDLGPEEFAMRAAREGEAAGLEVEVLEEAALRELGAGALLAVGQGSVRPPRMVRLSWIPEDPINDDHLFLVGKGITFDTGGLSLKPANSMEKMKYDMGGAATMLGAITAIGRLQPRVRVSCLLVMAENMPSGTATRPGDIITAMNGKTIEVINTDAEGRLVLADALTYANRLGATHIINAATLTGAVSVALGSVRVALLGNHKALGDGIAMRGRECGERFWPLPMDPDYLEPMRGDMSDLRNAGADRKAGTITAAKFLEQFVEGTPWAHLDIAGTAWFDKVQPNAGKGASGIAIRTLVRLAEGWGS